MRIEYEINTVTIRPTDLKENYLFLLPMCRSIMIDDYKPSKRKSGRKTQTNALCLIDEIIDSINEE